MSEKCCLNCNHIRNVSNNALCCDKYCFGEISKEWFLTQRMYCDDWESKKELTKIYAYIIGEHLKKSGNHSVLVYSLCSDMNSYDYIRLPNLDQEVYV